MKIAIAYADEEKKRVNEYCLMVIDLLKPLSIKEKWLVLTTLRDSFPVDRFEDGVIK